MQRNSSKDKAEVSKSKVNIEVYRDHCCGCGECYAVCPFNAIAMKENKQGFLYPVVDEAKCIQCGKCVKMCAFNGQIEKGPEPLTSYAVKHIDDDIRANSRSGGVFTAISDAILDLDGVVYGCKLVEHNKAVHTRATTREERDLFRGSKYIQSETYDIFTSIKSDLEKGSWVLFSGTACQVNAVRDFCKEVDCSKLLLVDIVCHGVPSPKVWRDYLKHFTPLFKKIVDVDFRDKKRFGWADHKETIYFSDGKTFSSDVFKTLFYSHLILRENCFECPFKSLHRIGDITIADCWGIHENYPAFDDNRGVSLVLVNSKQGNDFLMRVMKSIKAIDVETKYCMQPPLQSNWDKPKQYNQFWADYEKKRFSNIIRKYVFYEPSLAEKIKNRIKVIESILR